MMSKKILIVDDSEIVRLMVQKLLHALNHRSITAANGIEALEILKKEPVELVLLDQMMPDLDGVTTFKEILKQVPSPPPVIMVTALDDLELVIEFMKLGGSDFIKKPLTENILNLKIGESLKKHKLRSQLQTEKVLRLAAESSRDSKSEFLTNMTHELQTPIHGILSFAKLGVEKADSQNMEQEKIKHYFEQIHSSSLKLTELMATIIDLSRFEAGTSPAKLQMNSLTNILSSLIKNSREKFTEKKIDISIQIRTEYDEAYIDSVLIYRVLTNLLDNAFRDSKEGTAIIVTLASVNRFLLLKLEDQGVGIPEDELKLIFDKFTLSSRTKTGAGGVGLGLSICKAIIELHHGRIWAENRTDGGSCFQVLLPKNEESYNRNQRII